MLGLLWFNPINALPKCIGEDNFKWTMCESALLSSNGGKYVGEFKDGVFHGQGTFTYIDGNEYTGTWAENKRDGQGTFTYIDGSEYTGTWAGDKRDGQGTPVDKNGKKKNG